jgi:hypothetical protein
MTVRKTIETIVYNLTDRDTLDENKITNDIIYEVTNRLNDKVIEYNTIIRTLSLSKESDITLKSGNILNRKDLINSLQIKKETYEEIIKEIAQ